MKFDKNFLTALVESQGGQQQKQVKPLTQAKVDEDLIKAFVEWYNKENNESTLSTDWEFTKEKDRVTAESNEYNESYEIFDDYDSAKEIAFENFKSLFDELGLELFNKSNIGHISSYLTDGAEEDLRRDAENDLYMVWDDMRDSDKEEIAEEYGFDWEAKDADQLYADEILSKYRYPSEYWEELLGDEDFEAMVKQNADYWLDTEKLFNEVVTVDSIGPSLNSYDGEYYEAGDYIVIRVK